MISILYFNDWFIYIGDKTFSKSTYFFQILWYKLTIFFKFCGTNLPLFGKKLKAKSLRIRAKPLLLYAKALLIKAKRYDELTESVVKIKMKAEERAHSLIDEAQEKAMDTIMLIDDIEKEIKLFREDINFLRRDIKIGTVTLDDRLGNIYLRLCKNLDRLTDIKENFYLKNSLPMDDEHFDDPKGSVPVITYPEMPVSESQDE